MTIVHLTASPFFGGPERQMLGLAMHLPPRFRSHFLSFAERGLARPFLSQLHNHSLAGEMLNCNTPHLRAASREVAGILRRTGAGLLCCHGYKADVVGWLAARSAGVPVVAVSRGWTGATAKVRLYERLDRLILRWMDQVVCVSEAQARLVRHAGVARRRVAVIRNAIDPARFDDPDPRYRQRLLNLFPTPPERLVVAAGRLSPEKGFDQLIEAAAQVCTKMPTVGFVIFGDGPMRASLRQSIAARGLADHVILAGFRDDLDGFVAQADLLALASYTEGLPNVVLEAQAAGVPAVATAVGGTPEVIVSGCNGVLVPPGQPTALADAIAHLMADDALRCSMGQRGRQHIRESFTFNAQAAAYGDLFDRLAKCRPPRRIAPLAPSSALAFGT